ncbi:hypothetical protein Ga0100231_006275 [Opitutaceae bacterium TAV4]|nr:hypothetical protein Ga0100231_006275 [Opitutaceae bacterium TAV4]
MNVPQQHPRASEDGDASGKRSRRASAGGSAIRPITIYGEDLAPRWSGQRVAALKGIAAALAAAKPVTK